MGSAPLMEKWWHAVEEEDEEEDGDDDDEEDEQWRLQEEVEARAIYKDEASMRAQCGRAMPLVQTSAHAFMAALHASHQEAGPLPSWRVQPALRELAAIASSGCLDGERGDFVEVAWLSLRTSTPPGLVDALGPLTMRLTTTDSQGFALLAMHGACTRGRSLRDLTYLGCSRSNSEDPLLVLPRNLSYAQRPLHVALLAPRRLATETAPWLVHAEYSPSTLLAHPTPSARPIFPLLALLALLAPRMLPAAWHWLCIRCDSWRRPPRVRAAAVALFAAPLAIAVLWPRVAGAIGMAVNPSPAAPTATAYAAELGDGGPRMLPFFLFTPLPAVVYPHELAVFRTAVFEALYPPMRSLFLFLATVPLGLLALAGALRALSPHALCLAALTGYHLFTVQAYWGHRFVHYQMRRQALLPAHTEAVAGPSEGPADGSVGRALPVLHFPPPIRLLFERCQWLGFIYDPHHHLHHADPGDADEVIEELHDVYYENARYIGLSNVLATAPLAALLLRRRARRADRGGVTGDRAAFVRLWGALAASILCGHLSGIAIYEVLHLSSHLPRRSQPDWLWHWSSAHRLHHRDPTVNFGFHDSTWDWVHGTLMGVRY